MKWTVSQGNTLLDENSKKCGSANALILLGVVVTPHKYSDGSFRCQSINTVGGSPYISQDSCATALAMMPLQVAQII